MRLYDEAAGRGGGREGGMRALHQGECQEINRK